jgi:hypothetical protein
VPWRIQYQRGSTYELWDDDDTPKFDVTITGEGVLRNKVLAKVDGRSCATFMGYDAMGRRRPGTRTPTGTFSWMSKSAALPASKDPMANLCGPITPTTSSDPVRSLVELQTNRLMTKNVGSDIVHSLGFSIRAVTPCRMVCVHCGRTAIP